MDATPVRIAWQPLTPRGVATFAHARGTRLLLVQFIVALLGGVVAAWVLHHSFFPVITAGINQLPLRGEIRGATLDWPGASPQLLAENKFLSLAVDLEHSGEARGLAQFHVEFGRTNVWLQSLVGRFEQAYPRGWSIALNQEELLPRWGAWRPVWLALALAGTVVYLLATWALLATLYCGPIWVLGFYANRDLTLRGSWKLSGAALMPGAGIMLVALWLYGAGRLDLIHLCLALAVHLVTGWVYLVVSLPFVRRVSDANLAANPFRTLKK